MDRKKVNITYIENYFDRRATCARRAQGLIKKTREISVLCGIDACAIVYGQDGKKPIVWPSSKAEVTRIFSNYERKSQVNQSERFLNQKTFLDQSVKKAEEKLKKIQKSKREIKMENLATDIMNCRSTLEQVPPNDLKYLILVIENRLRCIEHRIRVMERGNNNNNISLPTNSIAKDVDTSILNPNQFLGNEAMTGIDDFMSQVDSYMESAF
ncbi:agamous-like MADS-box protein AGL80 [Spinacia oleracea]|uniref:Agamous-like MADS-box protein AGL80 n=1 Tax=Spinacia oleracea TaxID=3562 RepID=A0A9R0I8J3_SPIOL|nr:agamous-like MADS-box protein AGL80 [Spinacia oleracea]